MPARRRHELSALAQEEWTGPAPACMSIVKDSSPEIFPRL